MYELIHTRMEASSPITPALGENAVALPDIPSRRKSQAHIVRDGDHGRKCCRAAESGGLGQCSRHRNLSLADTSSKS